MTPNNYWPVLINSQVERVRPRTKQKDPGQSSEGVYENNDDVENNNVDDNVNDDDDDNYLPLSIEWINLRR